MNYEENINREAGRVRPPIGSVNRQAGFTLMEMLASVAVLMVLVVTAVGMFSRSLKSSAYVESQRLLDSSARSIIDSMTKYLRESKVVSLGPWTRLDCPGTFSGTSLVVRGIDGALSNFSLSGTNIASNSSNLNPTSVEIGSFSTEWTCGSGQPDRLEINFSENVVTTYREGLDGSVRTKNYTFGTTLRNSNN